jgi:hypothetical protein
MRTKRIRASQRHGGAGSFTIFTGVKTYRKITLEFFYEF